jgi:hydrogenase 3 maturation protease
LAKTNSPGRVAIVGIGQELNGDDIAGLLVVRQLSNLIPSQDKILLVEAGSVPESFLGVIDRYQPDLVLLVDAVNLGAKSGALSWISLSDISGYSGSSHSLPLTLFVEYLSRVCSCEIALLGVQPATTAFTHPMSPEVLSAVSKLTGEIMGLISRAYILHEE